MPGVTPDRSRCRRIRRHLCLDLRAARHVQLRLSGWLPSLCVLCSGHHRRSCLRPPWPDREVVVAPTAHVDRTISYGAYLWHSPSTSTSRSSTGTAGVSLLAVRFSSTFALAAASYYLIERPVMYGAFWRSLKAITPAMAMVGATVCHRCGNSGSCSCTGGGRHHIDRVRARGALPGRAFTRNRCGSCWSETPCGHTRHRAPGARAFLAMACSSSTGRRSGAISTMSGHHRQPCRSARFRTAPTGEPCGPMRSHRPDRMWWAMILGRLGHL